MKISSKNSAFVSLALHITGFLLCVVPPVVCTLNYFPFWRTEGYESCIAGGCAFLLVICALPLFKLFAKALSGYSSYFIWLILFLLFLSLSKIADQMTVISFVGLIGNLLGAILFRIAKKIGRSKE